MNTLFPKTDSNSVIGEYFELEIPSIISPKLNLQVKKLHGSHGTVMNIELDLNAIEGRCLSIKTGTLPANNIIFKTPQGFKAIDYYAQIEGVRLPDCDEACDEARSTLIAVQVTIKTSDRNKKISTSIVGIDKNISSQKNVIFVLINPNWMEFDVNYSAAVKATSGIGARRFSDFWYGQPHDFTKFTALHNIINGMFKY